MIFWEQTKTSPMRLRFTILAAIALFAFLTALLAQVGFKEYPYEQVNPAPVPPDATERTEWAFARLRYPSGIYQPRGWHGTWSMDFPKADRQFLRGVRRLTTIHACSAERVINLDLNDGEIFYWPWTYAVEVGHWDLTDQQCGLIREYLLRGGFLMTDDYHGVQEWAAFTRSLNRIFPDRPIEEIPNDDPIFHILYDLSERIQVPGTAALERGVTYEHGGTVPHWRCIRDDKGRIMVAMCFNQDNGDAWEWADAPEYPERATAQAYRLGINYIVYSMTH